MTTVMATVGDEGGSGSGERDVQGNIETDNIRQPKAG